MKTIKWLNEHWWYRLVKVSYIGFVILCSVIAVVGMWGTHEPTFDKDNSYVLCDDERKFFLNKYGMYSDYVSISDDRNFRTWCATEMVEVDGVNKFKLISGPVPETKNYELVAKYIAPNWFRTIKYSLLSLIGVLIVAELGRRAFYYVVLGSVRPKNNESDYSS